MLRDMRKLLSGIIFGVATGWLCGAMATGVIAKEFGLEYLWIGMGIGMAVYLVGIVWGNLREWKDQKEELEEFIRKLKDR